MTSQAKETERVAVVAVQACRTALDRIEFLFYHHGMIHTVLLTMHETQKVATTRTVADSPCGKARARTGGRDAGGAGTWAGAESRTGESAPR